jgi:hypothetical protein
MALLVKYHTMVSMYDVDPSYDASSSGDIKAGMLVGLNSSGYVAKANGATVQALGFAGDSISTSRAYTNGAKDLVINSNGKKRWTQNRVSDMFDETAGSGKMSVYTGTGEFYTDQYTGSGLTYGATVYASTGLVSSSSAGNKVGFITGTASKYPSGVPGSGSGAIEGSMSLNTFITVLMTF